MVANFARRSARSDWLHAGVVAFVLAVCLLLVGIDGWRTWQDRTRAIDEDRIETTNLATSLAQHAHDVVQAADAALFAVRAQAESNLELGRPLQRLQGTMMARVANLSVLHGLFIFDAAGQRIVSSLLSDTNAANYSDRRYFQYHRTHPDRGVYVGNPIHSKADGSWIIPVSRRIDTPDGRFAGVAVATISIDFLQRFYDRFNVGTNGVITLESMNGIVIAARRPYSSAAVGSDVSKGPIHSEFLKRSPAGSFRDVSPIDGVYRLGSYRRIADYPLVIIVAHDFHEVLADWRLDTWRHLAVSVGAAAALAFLGSRFARQIRIGQEAESGYRLLADNSSNAIICANLNGRKLYVSPSFSKLTGWSVEEALRMEWGSMVHPDDRQATLDIKVELLAGADVTTRFRYIRKDGSALWVEARLQRVEGTEGSDVPYVANIRDITERKAAEDQIMALNRKLVAQANTDGLTGLANRRRFDEALSQEWKRAGREAYPLSLLMIDVDRFKYYNDRYGHQQGDRCLRRIAAAIAECVHRPGDLIARYGGEELAVLLPATHASGAADLARRVRIAVENAGLAHEDSPPGKVVTVSIGVATMDPRLVDATGGGDELVAIADAALYEAKRDGRNRFVVAAAAFSTVGWVSDNDRTVSPIEMIKREQVADAG